MPFALTECPVGAQDISQGSSAGGHGANRLGARPPLVNTPKIQSLTDKPRDRANLICGPSNPQSAIDNPQSSILHHPSSSRIDALQAAIERMPQVDLPLTHRFTPGMYIRTIFMPKGALVISKIHRTQHPFVVTRGRCSVWEGQVAPAQSNGVQEINAGHIGITMPGTRRILYIHEDTEWTTFHATDKTTPEAIEADIIEPHDFDRDEALKLFVAASRECALTNSDQ